MSLLHFTCNSCDRQTTGEFDRSFSPIINREDLFESGPIRIKDPAIIQRNKNDLAGLRAVIDSAYDATHISAATSSVSVTAKYLKIHQALNAATTTASATAIIG
jgi:hypothetical protein